VRGRTPTAKAMWGYAPSGRRTYKLGVKGSTFYFDDILEDGPNGKKFLYKAGNRVIASVTRNPWFYYQPERYWNADPNEATAKLAPGPNNPAGSVWMGLSKPHYGIHGTPDPGHIRHDESYGCIRLTNWDADELSHMVSPGLPAILQR